MPLDNGTRRAFLGQMAISGGMLAIGPHLFESAQAANVQAQAMPSAATSGGDVRLTVNGKIELLPQLDPRVTLLDALRERLHLTGSKKGCDHGQCGACTVLINGRRMNACLTLAVMHEDDQITTVEGLADGDRLNPVQAAFLEQDGFQCGYCTPGQICSAVACIDEGHTNSDDEIREWMSGNLCRCGAYPNIVAAVKAAVSNTRA